jgi:hypothetical protein
VVTWPYALKFEMFVMWMLFSFFRHSTWWSHWCLCFVLLCVLFFFNIFDRLDLLATALSLTCYSEQLKSQIPVTCSLLRFHYNYFSSIYGKIDFHCHRGFLLLECVHLLRINMRLWGCYTGVWSSFTLLVLKHVYLWLKCSQDYLSIVFVFIHTGTRENEGVC